jgi:hypothetical protein
MLALEGEGWPYSLFAILIVGYQLCVKSEVESEKRLWMFDGFVL